MLMAIWQMFVVPLIPTFLLKRMVVAGDVFILESDNPFEEDATKAYVAEVKNGWVKYRYSPTSTSYSTKSVKSFLFVYSKLKENK